ncbi:MAG: sialidase family protein [Patescibacteria group bacterium]|nr:sialidase family protein [Patescibacteria group bacterium]
MTRTTRSFWLTFMVAAMLISGLALWQWRNEPIPMPPAAPFAPVRPAVVSPNPNGGINEAIPPTAPEAVPPPTTEIPTPPPPPVQILPMNAQRLERVEFNPFIGDIFRVVYDRSSENLFMTVVESDGMRGVWKLSKDLQIERVLKGNNKAGEVFLGQTTTGVLIAQFDNPGSIYRSVDLGRTWQKVSGDIDGAFWQIADDGKGTVWGALHAYNKAILYRSTDDGLTWEPWRDFQKLYPEYATTYAAGDNRLKLRHLHSVAYLNGRLFVGTGDMARFTFMSSDNGETWKKIWDEGFTASVPLEDRSGLILGPDRLQARGLAVYKLSDGSATEVWQPRQYGYAGYTYSMTDVGGSYFAAFHNETNETSTFTGRSGIIVSPDGYRWYPFLEFEKLNNWARTDIFMTPLNQWQGYVTLNGGLYRFEAPIGRWYEMHKAFGDK